MNPDIWLFDLQSFTATNRTQSIAGESVPMWHGDTLYFFSDRDAAQRANLWACDRPTGQTRQVTMFQDFDVHLSSAGPTRTWGGLIGMTGWPGLIDGGSVTVPTFGIYDPEKPDWIIEGHGVDPDIEVIDDPAAMARGEDPQLERAITEVLAALEKTPVARPQKPAYPNRSGL